MFLADRGEYAVIRYVLYPTFDLTADLIMFNRN
jgi:hypothetical protein